MSKPAGYDVITSLKNAKFDFMSVTKTILLIVVVYFVAKFIKHKIVQHGKDAHTKHDGDHINHKKLNNVNLLYKQFAIIAFYAIILSGLIFIVPIYLGIEPKIFLSILSPFIIALGFSLPNQIANIWCSLIMTINNVFKVNDLVTVSIAGNKLKGRIVEINLFHTKIAQAETGHEIIVTNNVLMGGVSINSSNVYDSDANGQLVYK